MVQLSHEEVAAKRAERYGEVLRGGSVTFIEEPAQEKLFSPIISVDDHAIEPTTMFENRLARKFAESAPRVVRGDDGKPWWVIDGAKVPIMLVNGAAGRVMSEWSLVPSSFDEMRRGTWDSTARLRDMDQAGVWASLCFGSVIWGFAGTRFSKMNDAELGLACLRAYNDWHIDEWCAADPRRFIPCQLPWLADPVVAAEEIRRNAERGFRAVSFSENPEGLGFPNVYSAHWDPFLHACEDTGTVVNLHVGSSGTTRLVSTSSVDSVAVVLFPIAAYDALVDWTYAGIPLRFPRLKVALSEGGVSWVPTALERLRRAFRQRTLVGKEWPGGELTPEELVRRTFVFTSIEDPSAFQLLDVIGEDSVMVETDYPHFDTTWPTSQEMIRSELSHLKPATVRKVCYENAARIYRSELPPSEAHRSRRDVKQVTYQWPC